MKIYPLIGMPQGAEWLVILAIVILVFGAAKLPDLARSTGQALKIFKSETKGLIDDDDAKDPGRTTAPPAGELPSGQTPPGDPATGAGGSTATESSTEQPADRHPG